MAGSPLARMLGHFQKLAASKADGASDASLLAQFTRDQSEEAFVALVWRHGPLVWRVCRRVLGPADGAEDAFQAAFLVLARKARSIKKTKSLASWLHGVAFRVACQLRTQNDRQGHHDRRSPSAAADDPGADLDRLWSRLGADASEGCPALWDLAAAPETALPYLQDRLRPATPLDAARVQRLIGQLSSDVFAQRDQAFRELQPLGKRLAPFLHKVIANGPSLELKRRAEALLAANPTPEVIRGIRGIAVLEHIGSRAALDLLKTLARGDSSARETWEAERAVERVSRTLKEPHG
jgi:RNA polymerase sigma factor (sigma-70 family)